MSARRPRGRRSESEAPHWRPRELPFYAADDTRLHWAILAGCMVSKGLTESAAEGRTGTFRRLPDVIPGRPEGEPGIHRAAGLVEGMDFRVRAKGRAPE